MLEKMQEQDEFANRSTLDEVNEIDGADEEFRPATNDMFEMKEPDSLFDDYRLSTINKLPTWAKKQVITSVDMEVSVITESFQSSNTSILNTRAKPEGRWAERFNPLEIFPDSLGETDKAVDGSPETRPFQHHLDLLANTPLEKRHSNGSLTDEPIFLENAEAALQLYEKEIKNNVVEDLQCNVTVSRGSDINVEAIQKCRVEEEDSSDHNDSSLNKESDEDIIYYPNEEELDGEVASLSTDKMCKTNPSKDSLNTQTNPTTKSDPNKSEEINEVQTTKPGYKIPLKKRCIEDILQSPTDEVGYFEMRSGHSMDNLVIHEVEFALLGRRDSTEQTLEAVPYDVKIYEDCGDEKELETQNTESNSKDETDEPTGDSISDEEDLLTTEIVPKWDELPEIPAPSIGRADVENNKEFFIENFECLGSTPTEDKEEPVFQSATEEAPSDPSPFVRNTFQRTSISARFIQRSKKSSARSTPTKEIETSSNENIDILEQKNIELEKRREELESTKKRLEAMGFKSLDNWTKKHTDSQANEDSTSNIVETEGEQNSLPDVKQATIVASKPAEITDETSQQNEPDKAGQISVKTGDSVSLRIEVPVFEKVEVFGTDESRESEAGSPSKKASELIAFFDSGQNEKTSKIKANKKTEKAQTRTKLGEKKAKDKHINSKTTLNKLKDEEKAQKSQNRKSFPFSLTKLTKTKGSDRRRSAPKTNLSKAKSCGDLIMEQKSEDVVEQKPRKLSHAEEEQKNKDVLTKQDSENIVDSNLSELSAELSAALATPAPKLIELDLSRDYLMGNGDISTGYRSLAADNEKAFSSEVTTNECQEVVVNLVRAFERALDCHSKILNGDIKDNQRQGLSMLAATFTTIHESISECKNERERRLVRSPRASKNTETNSEEHAETQHALTKHTETKDSSQQTEHVFTTNENGQITPLLEKYSELLLKKFEEKMNNK
ncbi:Hypothetical predicted protein [Paramuricea clavata]|uniref:Uncharacterized protein n=2 Tax=Paramuricea clavata TaxID=317549 RepID=A0A6S7JH31_PARCT|nr:Hypothetical predicted protein [Paramuricea clavata]